MEGVTAATNFCQVRVVASDSAAKPLRLAGALEKQRTLLSDHSLNLDLGQESREGVRASHQTINRVAHQRHHQKEQHGQPHAKLWLRSLFLGLPVVHGLRETVALEARLLLRLRFRHDRYPVPG